MHRVDYDDIAHLYDDPRRDHVVDANLIAFVRAIGRPASAMRVLDVGCGTGKQLAANRACFAEMRLIGVDRFRGMLRVAKKRRADVTWLQGDGQALPFLSERFDYATNQFSYPHIADKPRLMGEIFRVLKPGGRFVLTNIDPWSMPNWIIYRYFPETRDLDARDFAPVETLVDLMKTAGFGNVESQKVDASRQESLRAFFDSVSARHSASQLMAISDAAYRAGVELVDRTIAGADGHDQLVPSDFVLVTITGDK